MLSPGCGQLMAVCVIMVIIVIKPHDTNLSLSRRVRHTTTGHQTQRLRQLGHSLLKKYSEYQKFKHIILSQPAGGTEAIVRSL